MFQATEPIVDFALAASKPFAVVPCCVFPSHNQHRKTPKGGVVTTLAEFVDYLVNKNPERICQDRLDNVPGCNRIVWFRPENDVQHQKIKGEDNTQNIQDSQTVQVRHIAVRVAL